MILNSKFEVRYVKLIYLIYIKYYML